ncbi:hypothetical protein PPACK8108_LOCUS2514 [Phakopsora pachyrhizi]|uniref:Transcription factor domain-containing protein n=1 Tax=Phakopsora pachyrhizi TaxID=170000 RepID=A0AAV0AI22_PHAPC|nr:hypothetical protein PPACK8108_LOCUS2514 [Phakopsora pachyrhizi]
MRKNNPDFSSDTKPSNSLSCAGGSQLTNPVNEIAQGAVTTKTALTTQGNRFARKSVAKRYFLSAKCKARARNSSSRNAQISPITPKPRPKLPEELTSGFPLRQPTLGHDPTQPKTLETDGLRFEKKEAVAWPRRGDAAHRVQFLLNPILNPGKNPAEDNIPDFTPPPSESPSRKQMSPFAGYSSDQDEAQRLSTELRTVYIPGTDPNKLEPRTINTSHAEKYWSIFFQNYSNRLTWSSQESQQMETIRSASDLVLSAILSVSSKALKKQTQTNAFFCEATTLIRCTMFPERDYNYEDLKGIMTVAIYHGLHSVCGHFVSLCLVLKLHKVFVKLTDVNLRGTATEEELVEKGRTWLLVVIYSHMFCVFSKKMYLIRSPQKVITDHAKILMSSKCSKDCDRLIEAHVELVVILANAQDKLDVRNYPGPVEQRRSNYVVPELFVVLQSLDDWYEEWRFRAPELFVTIDRGFAKSLRNPQQYVYMYLMHAAVWPCQDGKIILQDRLRLHWAIEGCKYAERILETALELKESTNPRIEDAYHVETRSLPFRVEYEKVTLGLVTGYLLWICQVIPGYIELRDYRQLLGRLHSIDFHDSCEYIDLIEESISRIDEILGYQLQAQEESENNGLRKEAPLVNGKNGAGENFGGEREDQESSGEYWIKEGIGVIEDRMANELERLMTDTRFWFQIDIDVEF